MCNRTRMGYTNCLEVRTMKELNLFDNIPYKYIKNIIERNDDDIEVEIEDLPCDRDWDCRTKFTFLISQGKDYSWDSQDRYKKFVVEKDYNGSSPFALIMCNLYEESDDEDDDEDDEYEEVRCVCSSCFGEGKTLVSAERAKELKEKDLMEDCCPFGDKCNGEDDSEEEEDNE